MNYMHGDTLRVLTRTYNKREILDGSPYETPIFDRLAAETFASDFEVIGHVSIPLQKIELWEES